jgi:hypothetical protein
MVRKAPVRSSTAFDIADAILRAGGRIADFIVGLDALSPNCHIMLLSWIFANRSEEKCRL